MIIVQPFKWTTKGDTLPPMIIIIASRRQSTQTDWRRFYLQLFGICYIFYSNVGVVLVCVELHNLVN